MLTLIGLAIIITIVTLLMTGKVNPMVAMSVIPFIGAVLAGFSFQEITTYFEAGIAKVAKVATMFMFAILFFSIMKELHIFTPLINMLVKLTKGNVIAVCVITTLIAGVVHLDGSGAATFLIIIPALLPLYRRLRMSPYLMLLLMCISMGIMNMVPWGGPLGRASAVTQIDAALLWQSLIPVQLIGMAGAVVFAIAMGIREKRRIASNYYKHEALFAENITADDSATVNQEITINTKQLTLNVLLILIVITCLAFGLMSAAYTFMLAFSVALVFNFPHIKDQTHIIAKFAPQALNMAGIILAGGAFLGIMSEGGMLNAIAEDLASILPEHWIAHLHIAVGILGVPLDIFTSTDAYYYALLPIIQQITSVAGVEADSVVYAMAIGNNAGTFISPFAPAVWLAIGLTGLEMRKHLIYSFFWIWAFSFYTLGIGYLLGLY